MSMNIDGLIYIHDLLNRIPHSDPRTEHIPKAVTQLLSLDDLVHEHTITGKQLNEFQRLFYSLLRYLGFRCSDDEQLSFEAINSVAVMLFHMCSSEPTEEIIFHTESGQKIQCWHAEENQDMPARFIIQIDDYTYPFDPKLVSKLLLHAVRHNPYRFSCHTRSVIELLDFYKTKYQPLQYDGLSRFHWYVKSDELFLSDVQTIIRQYRNIERDEYFFRNLVSSSNNFEQLKADITAELQNRIKRYGPSPLGSSTQRSKKLLSFVKENDDFFEGQIETNSSKIVPKLRRAGNTIPSTSAVSRDTSKSEDFENPMVDFAATEVDDDSLFTYCYSLQEPENSHIDSYYDSTHSFNLEDPDSLSSPDDVDQDFQEPRDHPEHPEYQVPLDYSQTSDPEQPYSLLNLLLTSHSAS